MFTCPEIWNIGASCIANEWLHWFYLNMFSITCFFCYFLVNIWDFLWMRYQIYFFLTQPMMVTNQTTLPSQITFCLKIKSFYLVHKVCTNLRWPKFDLGLEIRKKFKKCKTFAFLFVWHLSSCHEEYETWDILNDSISSSQKLVRR